MEKHTPAVRHVRLGTRDIMYPSETLSELTDNTDLMGDAAALKRALCEQGYLLLRDLHSRDDVMAARLATLRYVAACGEDKLQAPIEAGLLQKRCGLGCIPQMEGVPPISHCEEVLKVLEGPRPKALFQLLLGEEPLTFDYKWLRGVHSSGFTGAHVDRVYMGWGTEELYTMWTPFDDVTVDMGTLAVCEGSHHMESFQHFQDTYGSFDVEKGNLNGSGWFTTDPFDISQRFGGQWKTTDFRAGDVLIFTMRWQKRSDKADPRFIGDGSRKLPGKKFGMLTKDEKQPEGGTTEQPEEVTKEQPEVTMDHAEEVTMEQLRIKWGLA